MNKNKIITIILALIMILIIIFVLTQGFNVEPETKSHEQLIISLGKEYEKAEIENIVKETMGEQKYQIKKVDVYGEEISIESEQITEEQKNTIITKLNEKYQTELKAEEIQINQIPRIKLKDYVMPHIIEALWVTPILLIYIIIRYRKLGKLRTAVQTVLGIIISEIFVFSIIAITRLQIGSNIPSIIFATYAVALIALIMFNEKQLQKIKEEEENKKEKNA